MKHKLGFAAVLLSMALGVAAATAQAHSQVSVQIFDNDKEILSATIRDNEEISSDKLGGYLVRLAFYSTPQWPIKGIAAEPDKAYVRGQFQLSLRGSDVPVIRFNELRLVRSRSERNAWGLTKDGVTLIELAMLQTRGRAKFSKAEFYDALGDFSLAIGLSPTRPELHVMCGQAHMGLKDYDAAIANFDMAIRLIRTNYPAAYLLRGQSFAAKGEFEKAVADNASGYRMLGVPAGMLVLPVGLGE